MLARPWLLLLLLLLPLWWWRRRAGGAPAVVVRDLTPLLGAGGGAWRAAVPPLLRSVAFAALVVAAAGPIADGARRTVPREGIAIAIAIDISSSMLAEDFAPSNRLEVAKARALDFVRARRDDRIALVAFAGEALTLVPATTDLAAVRRAIEGLRIGQLDDGTAIGSGLVTAVNRLRRTPERSRVVLLLTDGENNRGRIDPRTAAEAAAAFGMKVYTIGVGTEGEAPIPVGRGPGGLRYEMLPVRIDEPLMMDIAKATGGRYFRARDAAALGRVFAEVDRLERTPRRDVDLPPPDERPGPFALGALGALLLELGAAATVARRVP